MDDDANEASETLRVCFYGGLVLGVTGIGFLALAWPSDGDTLLWLVAIAVAFVGTMMALVAVVGWGVSLGVRASGRFTPPVSAPPPATTDPVRPRRSASEIEPLDPLAASEPPVERAAGRAGRRSSGPSVEPVETTAPVGGRS